MSFPEVGQPRKNEFADMAIYYSMTGWVEEAATRTWMFYSANDPEFVLKVDDDVTGLVSAGMKLRAKQDSDNYLYAFVTKVEISDEGTLVTVFAGTYDFVDEEPIHSVAFSNVKSPFGFPMNRDVWSIVMTDENNRTSGALGSTIQLDELHRIDLVTGAWFVEAHAYVSSDSTTNINVGVGISESSDEISDFAWMRGWQTLAVSTPVTPLTGDIDVPP